MTSGIKTGSYVHVVATINMKTGDGKILYVNPANSTIVSDAAPEPQVELAVTSREGKQVYRAPVVVRRSSCDHNQPNDVGLIQADLPQTPDMKSVSLLFHDKEVSRYEGGQPASAAGAAFGLALGRGPSTNRQQLKISELAGLQPAAGVTYSVQVKPDSGGPWNTIAVGRPTPELEFDRNQFAGAKIATVRVLRTTGFDEDVIAQDTVDLTGG
jgi:hypothetical protein